MNQIGDRLRKLRESTGLNQKQFAENINMKQTTYNGYETGKHVPKSEVLVLLAERYGVSVDYLLGKDPAPNAAPTTAYDQRLTELLQTASPEMKQALIVLLEQAQAAE